MNSTQVSDSTLGQVVKEKGDKRLQLKKVQSDGPGGNVLKVLVQIEQNTDKGWVASDRISLKASELDALIEELMKARGWVKGKAWMDKGTSLTWPKISPVGLAVWAGVIAVTCSVGWWLSRPVSEAVTSAEPTSAGQVVTAPPQKASAATAPGCVTQGDGSLECRYGSEPR